MTTHFITAEIDLQDNPVELQKAIAQELQKRGEPLRWSITSIAKNKKLKSRRSLLKISKIMGHLAPFFEINCLRSQSLISIRNFSDFSSKHNILIEIIKHHYRNESTNKNNHNH
jgi:hypothetical protein